MQYTPIPTMVPHLEETTFILLTTVMRISKVIQISATLISLLKGSITIQIKLNSI